MAAVDPFTYTATGFMGQKRETMLQNQLHLRPELGRPLRRGYTLPPEQFTYGRANSKGDGGAIEAITGWGSGSKLPFRRKEGEADRDFMALNRAAVQAGLVSAAEHYQFRANNDIRRRLQSDDTKKAGMTKRLPPTMVFGLPTRPSTPVYDLLEHKYQDQWLKERRSQDLARRQKEASKKKPNGKVYDTRAALLRVHFESVDPAPLWKLPKFDRKAKPHLDTFRGPHAKEESFKHHASDCISRKGVIGHGVYEQAKN